MSGLTDAATVVVARDTEAGVEVLMLQRPPTGSFAGAWVFPGGVLEAVDGTGDAAFRAAAVREAAEETGLSLMAVDLVEGDHWEPPAEAPRRFSTRMFFAAYPGGEVVIDHREIAAAVWRSPADLLAAHAREAIVLLPPTWMVLHELAGSQTVAAAARSWHAHGVRTFASRLVGGDRLVWSGDVAYDDGGLVDEPGPHHRLDMSSPAWRYSDTRDNERQTRPGRAPLPAHRFQ